MKLFGIVVISILVFFFAIALDIQPAWSGGHDPKADLTNSTSRPLCFVENYGQWDERVLFRADAGGATIFFCRDEVVFVLIHDTEELIDDGQPCDPKAANRQEKFDAPSYKKETSIIRTRFEGANPSPDVTGEERFPHHNNYFIGNESAKWRANVPSYESITYKGLYPGIDLKYYGCQNGLKYDFIVHPSADIARIRIKYVGTDDVTISNAGDLEIHTRLGPFREGAPLIYQEFNGRRRTITGRYEIGGDATFGFALTEAYDSSRAVVIDPQLVYSTFFGGTYGDYGYDIAADRAGNSYLIGSTYSIDFPLQNPYQTNQPDRDVYVSKISPDGGTLVYSTYLGGNEHDWGYGIAVDEAGRAHVTGYTDSNDFPMVNSYQEDQIYWDAFVAKFSASGDSLIFSTYLGGDSIDHALDIAIGRTGYVYVTGYTYSANFPTRYPFQTDQGGIDAFVTVLSAAGDSLVYSTYLGGSYNDKGVGIAVDHFGHAYITGETWSVDFPTCNPFQMDQPTVDAFVTELSPFEDGLQYSTYLGGNNYEGGYGIAVDGECCAFVTGYTKSINFPVRNPYQTYRVDSDVFVTKLSRGGDSLVYGTYLGGDNFDYGFDIAIDDAGNAYVTGSVQSTDFPTRDPFQFHQGHGDAFVTKLGRYGNSLVYSTYLGGSRSEGGNGIAVDPFGEAHVTGWTYSEDFPLQNELIDTVTMNDAFVTKFEAGARECSYSPGDINGNGQADGSDVIYGVGYFKGGNSPPDSCHCPPIRFPLYGAGDVNGNCAFNGVDLTFFVAYLKGLQPTLRWCPDCPPTGALPEPMIEPMAPTLKSSIPIQPGK